MTDQPAPPTPPEPAAGAPTGEDLPAPAIPAAVSSHAADGSWPSSAKTLTVVLAIGLVAAIVAAIAGFSQASSADDDKAVLEADRGAAIAQADAAEQERDDLAAQVAELGSSVDSLTAERDDAVDAVEAQDQLTNDLAAETERADAAEAVLEQLQVIAGQFPISLDSSLIPEDMPGSYEITYQEAYCDGFSTCGTLPTVSEATVYTTPDGFLRVEVEGILDAGLFALDGSLYGITDSLTALPACGGADTRARVTITMYAGAISVADDGTRTVNDVNASITIDAPSNGPDCPSGLVFYASSFTPVT